MFIGENLTDEQVAALQAIADATMGCQVASYTYVRETIRLSSQFAPLHDGSGEVNEDLLADCLQVLEKEYLISSKIVKGSQHFCLTEDGQRCNRIIII